MAEARVAANISTFQSAQSYDIHTKRSTFRLGLIAWRYSFIRKIRNTSNAINNGLWPTNITNLAATTGTFTFLLWHKPRFSAPLVNACLWVNSRFPALNDLPTHVNIPLISFGFGFTSFLVLLYVRRYLLRALLSYRGWMYVPPNREPLKTILWVMLVRIIRGRNPRLFSYQGSLPRLHVPSLNDTIEQVVESLKPVYGEDSKEIKDIKKMATEFEKTIGPKLQRLLILKSWMYPNYVSDWWEKYVYLSPRTPLLINSNYYVLSQCYWTPKVAPTARAANALHQLMLCRRRIERQELQPIVIRKTVPLCMNQYYRSFGTTRIPHLECDVIEHYHPKESQHVAVQSRGAWYHLHLYDSCGRLLSPETIEALLIEIVEDSIQHPASDVASHVASLTAWDRDSWARARTSHFLCGENKIFLDSVETSNFVVSFSEEEPDSLSEIGKLCLHGDGRTLWADKSICMIIFANSRIGVNCEHSWADALVTGHTLEYILDFDNQHSSSSYDSTGHVKNGGVDREKEFGSIVQKPIRLNINLNQSNPCDLSICINTAFDFHKKNSDDVDLVVADFNSYGKGLIKCFNVSPDGFIQMALCLAYYRSTGKFALTYESAQTRLFLDGRTETIRALSQESKDFVLAMVAEKADRGLRVRLLRRACERHVILSKDAMNGKGVDRHLFALYVACRGSNLDSPFLNTCLKMPWILSTSQQPQQQLENRPSCDLPEFRDKATPGGGFGPVSDQGYGISYMIAGDFRIFFHVSSKRSCINTDSTGFVHAIFESLQELKSLFDGQSEIQEKRRGSIVYSNSTSKLISVSRPTNNKE